MDDIEIRVLNRRIAAAFGMDVVWPNFAEDCAQIPAMVRLLADRGDQHVLLCYEDDGWKADFCWGTAWMAGDAKYKTPTEALCRTIDEAFSGEIDAFLKDRDTPEWMKDLEED